MGYTLYQSNRMETLLEQGADSFHRGDLFGPPLWFVVQNRNMAEWLILKLTDRNGITAGFDSLYPEQAIRQFSEHFEHPWRQDGPEPRKILFMDNLKIILYKKLEDIRKRKDRRFGLLLDFLDDDSRLFDMANVLAGLFYRYGMNCFDLVAAWEEGRSIGLGGNDLAHEEWQRLLWDELFGADAPYILLSRILVHIREKELPYRGPEGRIILFGSSFLGDAGLNFFSYLSRFLPVDHYLLTPSRVFLGEDRTPEPVLREWELLTSLSQGVAGFFADAPPRGIRYITAEDKRYGCHLLGYLQKSLWDNRFEAIRREDLFTPAPDRDDSIRFFSCTGPWRQVEAARNGILSLLASQKDLKLTDMAVMAPDINEFAPFIEALFGEDGFSLPYNFIDLKNQSQSAYTDGFLSLLELPASRYSRTDMFRLFRNPCFARAFGISEREEEEWDRVCRETGILWGIDGEHLEKLHLPARENNRWERGFDRLLDGMVYNSPEDRENRPFVFPDESRNISLGKLILIVRSLYEDFFPLTGQRMPVENWIPRLEQLMEKYLHVRPDNEGDSRDRERIKAVFRNINNLMEGLDYLDLLEDPSVPWAVCRSLILELVEKTPLRKGGYLTRGISCSSLKPLRAVPFRAIILLGMDYSVFPGRDEEFSFDLTELARPTVDLSRRASDRFSFLEALLSAREKFWVYYQGRNDVSGEVQHPSAVISDVKEMVERQWHEYLPYLDIQEALQPYDRSYFDGSRTLPSYDRIAFEQADLLYRGVERPDFAPPRLALSRRDIPEEITLAELMQFYRNPLMTYGKKSLRLFEKKEEGEGEELIDPVEPALFKDTRFYEELIGLWCEKGFIDPASLDSRARSWWERAVKEGHLSGNSWDGPAYGNLLARGSHLLTRLNGYDRTFWEGSVTRERAFEDSSGENREGETWYLKCPVLDTSYGEIRLTGSTGPLYGSEILSSASYLFGKKARSKDLFAPFLSHLIMAVREDEGYYGRQVLLAGEEGDRLAGWTSRSGQRADHFLPVPDPRETLTLLAELYLENLRDPLPFYPSLLDGAAENLEKQKWEAGDLPREWPRLWQKNLSGTWGAYDINSCPYREMLMPEPPEWDRRLEKLFSEILPYLR